MLITQSTLKSPLLTRLGILVVIPKVYSLLVCFCYSAVSIVMDLLNVILCIICSTVAHFLKFPSACVSRLTLKWYRTFIFMGMFHWV